MKQLKPVLFWGLFVLGIATVITLAVGLLPVAQARCSNCPTASALASPPPAVGQLGGPYAGLTSNQTILFNQGYGDFNLKWDPFRGVGPVLTKAGCFSCHGGGTNALTGIAGDTTNQTGTRYGKFNPDGTFNYLDGTGTYPENEGGPTLHNQSVSQFGTLLGCSRMGVADAVESGTTVTITTSVPHNFESGFNVAVTGVGDSGYNGTFLITSIPSSTSFSYSVSKTGLPQSGGGTADPMPNERVPRDATIVSQLRSPQLFGLGLVDNIPDFAIEANAIAQCTGSTCIPAGLVNLVPDENGVVRPGRFGQKSSVVSLFQFTARAFWNELGITNSLNPLKHLPQGLPYSPRCQDDPNSPNDVGDADFIKAVQFTELLAPVSPQPPSPQTSAGHATFESIGCSLCHVESFTTQPNVTLPDSSGGRTPAIGVLSNVTFNPYSDFLLHDLGATDSGGIPFEPGNQGQANLTQWRTAPLWGLSDRLSKAGGLMHDNGSLDINSAILRHGNDAAQVISNYQALSSTDQADLLAFLGSL